MADLGKVVVTDGGTYSASTTYEKLTFVHYQGDAYLTLKTVKGVTPSDDGTNYRLFCKSAEVATATKAGIVLPDGSTITISNGKISAKTATQTTLGVVKGSDDIKITDGAASVNTQFTQATQLANIIAGEAIKSVLGKVSKAIATTMSLDENALLKNMISGIDVNDGNKVPSSAYIHSLVERIGMGTALEGGFDNLTAGLNSVNNNLSQLLTNLGINLQCNINNFPALNANSGDAVDITFGDAMPDLNYVVVACVCDGSQNWSHIGLSVSARTKTGFRLSAWNNSENVASAFSVCWITVRNRLII